MKSTRMVMLGVCAFVLGLCVADMGYAKGKDKQHAIHGTVVKVEGQDVVVSVKKGEQASEVTVATDDQTVVKIDGQSGAVGDLAAGMHVTVPAFEGTAKRINASTKGGGDGGHGGHDH